MALASAIGRSASVLDGARRAAGASRRGKAHYVDTAKRSAAAAGEGTTA